MVEIDKISSGVGKHLLIAIGGVYICTHFDPWSACLRRSRTRRLKRFGSLVLLVSNQSPTTFTRLQHWYLALGHFSFSAVLLCLVLFFSNMLGKRGVIERNPLVPLYVSLRIQVPLLEFNRNNISGAGVSNHIQIP